MSKRKVSVHELKRRLMRRMNGLTVSEVERIVVQLREYGIVRAFLIGLSVENLVNDTDHGGAWNSDRIESAIRNAAKARA